MLAGGELSCDAAIDGGLRRRGATPLDGDKDGVGGDEYNFTFHRFFGDSDGDRDVDARDRDPPAPRPLVHRPAGQAPFDSNGDGDP
jgi:hypothetical protein